MNLPADMDCTDPVKPTLVTLPPEVRNCVYHLVANNIKMVKVDACRHAAGDLEALQDHALSLTCRQIRKEFRPIYVAHAVQAAKTLEWRVMNFALMDFFKFTTVDRNTEHVICTRKRIAAVVMTLTPEVALTFNSLEKYLYQIHQQELTPANAENYPVRQTKLPQFPGTTDIDVSARLKYRIRLQLGPDDYGYCLDYLLALQYATRDYLACHKELSQIIKAFQFAAEKQSRRFKTAVDRERAHAQHMAKIHDSLKRHSTGRP